MGLDMYLKGKRYISDYDDQDKVVISKVMQLFPELSETQTLQEVTVRVGYWRKANQIHKWFVDNIQEGVDDCGDYYVSRESLQDLRTLCQQVIDFRHLATDKLPPQSGFFFGSDKVDEHYFRDLEDTIKIIDGALALPSSWDLEYSSSW
jgi:hypothetical protein